MARLEKNDTQTVLAAEFEGKRLNSPNYLAIRDNGDLYFTDPPYGLANFNDSPLKELPHHGVYRVDPKGEVTLLIAMRKVTSGLPVPVASSCSILLANILAPFSQTSLLATAVGATTAVPSTSPPTGSLFA